VARDRHKPRGRARRRGIVPLMGDKLPEVMRLTAMQVVGIITLLVGSPAS
jgi:hypothetical protein